MNQQTIVPLSTLCDQIYTNLVQMLDIIVDHYGPLKEGNPNVWARFVNTKAVVADNLRGAQAILTKMEAGEILQGAGKLFLSISAQLYKRMVRAVARQLESPLAPLQVELEEMLKVVWERANALALALESSASEILPPDSNRPNEKKIKHSNSQPSIAHIEVNSMAQSKIMDQPESWPKALSQSSRVPQVQPKNTIRKVKTTNNDTISESLPQFTSLGNSPSHPPLPGQIYSNPQLLKNTLQTSSAANTTSPKKINVPTMPPLPQQPPIPRSLPDNSDQRQRQMTQQFSFVKKTNNKTDTRRVTLNVKTPTTIVSNIPTIVKASSLPNTITDNNNKGETDSRKLLLTQFLTIEIQFSSMLKALQTHYLEPLVRFMKAQKMNNAEEVQNVIASLDLASIYSATQAFKHNLENVVFQNFPMGMLFQMMVVTVYENYVKNYPHCYFLINKLKKSSKVASFLESASNLAQDDILHMLRAPARQLKLYFSLVKELLITTPTEFEVEKEALISKADSLIRFSEEVDKVFTSITSLAVRSIVKKRPFLDDLSSGYHRDAVFGQRVLLREGILEYKKHLTQTPSSRPDRVGFCSVFLFSDVLVLYRKKGRKYDGWRMLLKECTVKDYQDDVIKKPAFLIFDSSQELKFICYTTLVPIKDSWMRSINAAITGLKDGDMGNIKNTKENDEDNVNETVSSINSEQNLTAEISNNIGTDMECKLKVTLFSIKNLQKRLYDRLNVYVEFCVGGDVARSEVKRSTRIDPTWANSEFSFSLRDRYRECLNVQIKNDKREEDKDAKDNIYRQVQGEIISKIDVKLDEFYDGVEKKHWYDFEGGERVLLGICIGAMNV